MHWPPLLSAGESVALGRFGPFGLLPYRLPLAERASHLYVLGVTGQGKSKLLEQLLVSDIHAGRGCGLVDPHADLARDTLAHLLSTGFFASPAALDRVIYFDPTRSDYILPFNVLQAPLPPYVIAQHVIEAFRRTWPQALEEAPRFANITLASLLVLIETGQSLVELPLLLSRRDYREQLLRQVRDPQLIEYFHDRLDRWGREGVLMMESVLNKVTAFTFNPYLRPHLGAAENRLNFREMMDEGQVLIVDLGNCDGETRRLLGSLVVSGMELAALTRKDQPIRRPFYLFLDEFQDFCASEGTAKTLAQVLSECRKFGLHLHLAHQTLGQIQERLISALGNVGTKIVFTTDRSDAEVMAPSLFSVNTEAVKHAAQTQTQHPLFAPLPEQWENAITTIQNLPPRRMLVKRRGRGLALLRTATIRPYSVGQAQLAELERRLAARHGEPRDRVKSARENRRQSSIPVRMLDWEKEAASIEE